MKKLTIVFLIITTISCTQTENVEREAVRTVVSGILDADNSADIKQVLAYYGNNAILMPAGKPEIKGEQAIQANYQKIFEVSRLNLHPEIESIVVVDDLAVCKGRTKGTVTSKADSAKIEVDDKFLMVLRKNQNWKISYLMWSKDN